MLCASEFGGDPRDLSSFQAVRSRAILVKRRTKRIKRNLRALCSLDIEMRLTISMRYFNENVSDGHLAPQTVIDQWLRTKTAVKAISRAHYSTHII